MLKIRQGIFETNSSSVHSMIMVNDDEYGQLECGEYYINQYGDSGKGKIVYIDDIINEIRRTSDIDVDSMNEDELEDLIEEYGYKSFDRFYENNDDYETFFETYTTKNGENVYAIGYYGHD